jgi:dUTP pyrophosphatase
MSDTNPAIIFEPLHDEVVVPVMQTEHSAGYDLRAYLRGRAVTVRIGESGEVAEHMIDDGRLELAPGDVALVPTGLKARVPPGYEAQVRIRSSMAFRRGLMLPNAPGTIDADYPDEWLVMIKNDSQQVAAIEHGERIAQAVINRVESLPWRKGPVGISTDRQGGLGSTGTGRDEAGA